MLKLSNKKIIGFLIILLIIYISWPLKLRAQATPIINPLNNLEIKIPGLDQLNQKTPAQCSTDNGQTNCTLPWIALYIESLYNYSMGIIGILAAIALMIGGVIWIVSAGNATRISQAKDWILGSITGLMIMFTSYILLNEINPQLVGLKPITVGIIDAYNLPASEQTTAPTSLSSLSKVPWLLQCSSEGKNINYGNCSGQSTVCSSGCGLVSTLMVLNYYGYSPTLNDWTNTAVNSGARTCGAGSNSAGLIKAAQQFGLNGSNLNGVNDITAKLNAGYPVIISVKGPCLYTSGGHFIVLTGWSDQSNSIASVNDPANSKNNPTKTTISLKNFAGCTLNQAFYLYK